MQVHGHRGCRGLMPENTLEAFQLALELGVDTLEMDVCISKDLQVVVSHEPWFNHLFCTQPYGIPIDKRHEKSLNLYRFNYSDIRRFDCGLKPYPRFPLQKKIATYKPLLRDVIALAESFSHNVIRYNIEIKYTPAESTIFHPDAQVFSDLLMEVLKDTNIHARTMVQCFDVNVLQYLHRTHPEQVLSYLVEEKAPVAEHLKSLGFMPHVYSPDYTFLTPAVIEHCHLLHIAVIPWTVNETKDMQALMDMGVDGIITDYPDQLIALMKK
jgi:glycerophosphoryl diester phosphodiesterase